MNKNKLLQWVIRHLPTGRQESLPVTSEELLIAISIGDEDTVRKLLTAGLNPNLGDHMGRLPLHTAVRQSNPVLIKLLVFGGADVNIRDEEEQNALMIALAKNDLVCGRELLRLDIDISARNLALNTALDIAQKDGKQDFVELIQYFKKTRRRSEQNDRQEQSLKFGKIKPQTKTPSSKTPTAKELHIQAKIKAQKDKRIQKAKEAYQKRLLKVRSGLGNKSPQKPTPPSPTPKNLSPKEIAQELGCPSKNRNYSLIQAIRQHRTELLPPLLKTGLSLERVEPQTLMTPLSAAVIYKNIEALDLLLENGAQVNAVYKGRSLLFYAIRVGDETIVKRLVEADCHLENQSDSPSPLCLAIKKNDAGLARLLLEAGADVNFCSNEENALKAMIAYGRMELLPLLLDFGANLNCNKTGRVALSWAIVFRKLAIFEELLKAGADVNAGRQEGKSILSQSIRDGANVFLEKLLSAGADVNIIDEQGKTPLTLAVHQNRPMLAQKLLDKDADPHMQDADGFSPLTLAEQLGRDAITFVLKKTRNSG